jgi:predicted kinase
MSEPLLGVEPEPKGIQTGESDKVAIIMRGLPGSGKSYWVEQYLQSLGLEVALRIKQYGLFSTDALFYHQGKYVFKAQKLSEYHQRNLASFIQALANGEPIVICDNTNINHWEYIAYEAAAKALGYQVKTVIVGQPKSAAHQLLCSQRNQHKVPLAQIKKMASMFEEG